MRNGSSGSERREVSVRKLTSVFVVATLAAMLLPAVSATAGGPAAVDFVVTDNGLFQPESPTMCRSDDFSTNCSRFSFPVLSIPNGPDCVYGVSEGWIDESNRRKIQIFIRFGCTNADGSGPDGFNLKLQGKTNSNKISWVFYSGTGNLSGVHGSGSGTLNPADNPDCPGTDGADIYCLGGKLK